jgi:hypothetical protein
MTSKELMQQIKDALAEAGMPRVGNLNGAEIKGWIDSNHYGSTGFSVTQRDDAVGIWEFNVVMCGKTAGLRYHEDRRTGEHEPIGQDRLCPRVQAVFEGLGFEVTAVEPAGYQRMWDHDVEFTVKTKHPERIKLSDVYFY